MTVLRALAVISVLCVCCSSLVCAQSTAADAAQAAAVGTASANSELLVAARKHAKSEPAIAKGGHAAVTPKAEHKHIPAQVSKTPDATTDTPSSSSSSSSSSSDSSGDKKKTPLIVQHSSKPAAADAVDKPADSSSKAADSTSTNTDSKAADSTTTDSSSSSSSSSSGESHTHHKRIRASRRPFTSVTKGADLIPPNTQQQQQQPAEVNPKPEQAAPLFKNFPTSSDILSAVRQKKAEREAKEREEREKHDALVREAREQIQKEIEAKEKLEQEKKAKEEQEKKTKEEQEKIFQEKLEQKVKEALEKRAKEANEQKKHDDEPKHDDDRDRKHDDEHEHDDGHDRRGRRGDWDSEWEHKKKPDDKDEKDNKNEKKSNREEGKDAAALEDIIEAIVGKLFDKGLPNVVPGIPGPEPKRSQSDQQYKRDDERYQQAYRGPGMVQEETAELQIIFSGKDEYGTVDIDGGLMWSVTAGADVNADLPDDKEAWSVQVEQGFKWDRAQGMHPFFSHLGPLDNPHFIRMRGKLGGAVAAAPGVLASTNSISTGGKVPRGFIKHARVSIDQPRTCLYRYAPVDAYGATYGETVDCFGKIVDVSPSLAFDGTFAEFLAVGVHQDLPFMDHVEVECEILECAARESQVDEAVPYVPYTADDEASYDEPYYGEEALEAKSKVPTASKVGSKVPSATPKAKSKVREDIWAPNAKAE